MLEYLRGPLKRVSPTDAVVDVGGLGFRVHIPLSTSRVLGALEPGQEVTLLTSLRVSTKDAQVLVFGFHSAAERELFELLTQVKGVGAAMAARVLSGASPSELREAIREQDSLRLTRVKGIGRKTAERIVFDLKDKLELVSWETPAETSEVCHPGPSEALKAMSALGYDPRTAKRAVQAALASLGPSAPSEELVRQALQEAT
jgi:holliday junction DNA helicase RuvA